MQSYRTEIVIAADRYLCLQLPAHVPTGTARVTIEFTSPSQVGKSPIETEEPDREDIEWWDEFEEEAGPTA
ncbi:MAG: hypothetical protein NVSMB9_00690 [Isosphaeraceae bacterium]